MESVIYIIDDIAGDYATLRRPDTGDTILVAMALLPFGADIGDTLLYENMCYTVQ
ncbi:MAG: hypothetical protein Q4F95_12435 [Oscillospiraceae bacterium]|nr:hypothetical protein [Oscillospiraceae bacterium]